MSGAGNDSASDLDLAIRQLLDQQAHIQSRLSVLLAAQQGVDMAVEVDMLRHKLRVLEDLVQRHDLTSKVPVNSGAEEARALQNRCEVLEVVCLHHDVDVVEPLRRSSSSAPVNFASWLDRHLTLHDKILRSHRGGFDANAMSWPQRMPPMKCWDERCPRFVYGFSDQQEHDAHGLLHSTHTKRDSGYSTETSPKTILPEPPPTLRGLNSSQHFRQLPSVQTSGLAATSSNWTAMSPQITPKENDDNSSYYVLHGTVSEPRGHRRSSSEADLDSSLPPLKKSKPIRPRLESIGELQLLYAAEPCLRCKIVKQKCDSSRCCANCSGMLPSEVDEHWSVIGCFRRPLTALADMILPGPISPRQTRTPITSPLAQRRSVNDYLRNVCSYPDHLHSFVKENTDYPDSFWWSAYLDSKRSSEDGSSGFNPEGHYVAPPSLVALTSSWHAQETAYSLPQLLGLTGLLCSSRESEESCFPTLYNAKLLLRETIFHGILHPDPWVQATFNMPSPPDCMDLDEHARLVEECLIRFLQSFETMCSADSGHRPRETVANFLAVCIFNASLTLLYNTAPVQGVGTSYQTPPRGSLEDAGRATHAIYRAMVQLFSSSTPPLFEGWAGNSTSEVSIYHRLNAVIRAQLWPKEGIKSSLDFLYRLGDGYIENLGFNGFFRQRRSNHHPWQMSPAHVLHAPHHEPRRPPEAAVAVAPGLQGWRPSFQGDAGLPPRRTSEVGPVQGPEVEKIRRHTVGGASAPPPRQLDAAWRSPDSPSRFRGPYQRAPLRRVHCDKCQEYPEGFRGEHELRRHTDAKHSALVRRWVCCDPEHGRDASPKPVVSLSSCKACMAQKQYGAYYNAAAHLRRAHFSPHRGGKASGDWPPMSVLKDWMREVRQPLDSSQTEYLSGGEDEGDQAMPETSESTVRTMPEAMVSRPFMVPLMEDPWRRGTSVQSNQSTPRPTDNRSQCPHPDCGRVVKDLAAHMLTHQEERPEKCPIVTCEYHIKGFARKYDKNRHALTHYRGTMVCPFCPGAGTPYEKIFGRADVFKRHLATAHNVDQTPTNNRSVSLAHLLDSQGSAATTATNMTTATVVKAGARCSICATGFTTAQDFYEHLDECVLRVIVPSSVPRSDPAQGHQHSELDDAISPLQAADDVDRLY